jgi:hypothetical protein
MLANRVGQKPRRGKSKGKARNMGSVGTTYQKVYQAWFAILLMACFSTYSQMSVKIVTKGKAATRPPILSLCFASSDTKTTTAAVMKYFVISQSIGVPFRDDFDKILFSLVVSVGHISGIK